LHEFIEIDDCAAQFDEAALGEQPPARGRFRGIWIALQSDFKDALHLFCGVFSSLTFHARGERVRGFGRH
jgi:hypothetical protein